MQKELQDLSQSQLISLALQLQGETEKLQQQYQKIESKSQNLETENLRLQTNIQ